MPGNFINPHLQTQKTQIDKKHSEEKHGSHLGENLKNPKKTHFMTPMQTQTTPSKSTVNPKLVERLREELEAENIFEIRPVGKNKYYVRYEKCEWAEDDGECFDIESYVTIKGKWIEEEVIHIG